MSCIMFWVFMFIYMVMNTYYRIWFAKYSIKLNIKYESAYMVFWAWNGDQSSKYSRIFQNITERYFLSTKLNIKFESIYIYGILRVNPYRFEEPNWIQWDPMETNVTLVLIPELVRRTGFNNIRLGMVFWEWIPIVSRNPTGSNETQWELSWN